jgi:hypothetical protein
VNGAVDIGAVEFHPPATTTLLSLSAAVKYGMPLTLTAQVTAQVPGNPVTGTVTFRLDGVTLGTAPIVNGTATLTITPTTGTLKPGNHSLTATYSGDVNFTPSATNQTLVAPALPVLTTKLIRKHGRFLLAVFNNGQPLQQLTLRSQPIIQMRDLNGDGLPDLVIDIKKGKNLMVVAAFSGADASRIV